MIVELLLLLLIAAGVFAFVLAPLVLPERAPEGVEDLETEPAEREDTVAAEQQTVHEPS